MTTKLEAAYWRALDGVEAARREMCEPGFRRGITITELSHTYRTLAETQLLWKEDLVAARESLLQSGGVISDFLTRVVPTDYFDIESHIVEWEVADALMALFAGQHFAEADRLASLASADRRFFRHSLEDFHVCLLQVLLELVRDEQGLQESLLRLRKAAKSERGNYLGFFTTLRAISDRDDQAFDTGLYQIELAHRKANRSSWPVRYSGAVSFPATGLYNLGVHRGLSAKLGFSPEFLASDLCL